MGARIASIVTLVVTGIVIANIIQNPIGTQAAGNALSGILKPTYNALLGQTS